MDKPRRQRLTIDDVRRNRPQILDLAAYRGVRNVRVFGSLARGETDENSDVDLLIDADSGTSLLDLSAFALDVGDLLGRHVDVVTVPGLKKRIRERVLSEAVAL